MKRREALQRIMIGTGTTVLLPASILSSCSEDPGEITPPDNSGENGNNDLEINLDEASNSNLNEEGGYKLFGGIIVVNTGDGNFIALSSVCTHQGCSVIYDSSADNFLCDCHGSLFSTSGNVLKGPASRPLKQYTVTRNGNILTIS